MFSASIKMLPPQIISPYKISLFAQDHIPNIKPSFERFVKLSFVLGRNLFLCSIGN